MKEGLTIGQLSEINAELHTEIVALKKQSDALAVENESLKAYRPQPGGMAMMEALDAFEAQDDYPEGGMMDAFEILCCKRLPTPATGASIAAIQAHGVDKLATFAGKEYQRFVGDKTLQRKWKGIVLLCTDFASQLRKESTHD